MQEKNKYRALYFTRNLGEFIFYIYLSKYLMNLDYSGTMIGTVLSFSPLFIVITLPVWGRIESVISRKHIIILAASMTLIMQYFLIIPTAFPVIVMFTIIYSFVRAPLYPSIDSMSTLYCIENNIEFSSVRSWGSLGYLIAVGVGGFLFDRVHFFWILVVSTFVFFAMFFFTAKIRPLGVDADKLVSQKKKGATKQILKNPFYIKFIIAQILCYTAINVNNGFDILYLTERGAPTYLFGIFTVGRIVFELLLFRVINKTNFSYKTLFAAVPVLMLVQCVLYFFEAPIEYFFGMIIFNGTAIGIIIYLNNKYIAQIVSPKNITRATYITAIVQNLSIAIFLFFAGLIYDNLGAKYIYMTTGIFFIIGFIFIMLFIKKTGKYTIVKYYD